MKLGKMVKQTWAATLILAIAGPGISIPARADLVPTADILASRLQESTAERVSSLLRQERVVTLLSRMGVDTTVAQERVGHLTARELQVLERQIDSLPAGEGALSTIALVLVIFILLDVAGVTDIFPAV